MLTVLAFKVGLVATKFLREKSRFKFSEKAKKWVKNSEVSKAKLKQGFYYKWGEFI